MILTERYNIGPSWGCPLFATNWQRRVYEYQGLTVYLDMENVDPRQYEVFAPIDGLLWYVGECARMTWANAERKAQELVDEFIERNRHGKTKETGEVRPC